MNPDLKAIKDPVQKKDAIASNRMPLDEVDEAGSGPAKGEDDQSEENQSGAHPAKGNEGFEPVVVKLRGPVGFSRDAVKLKDGFECAGADAEQRIIARHRPGGGVHFFAPFKSLAQLRHARLQRLPAE